MKNALPKYQPLHTKIWKDRYHELAGQTTDIRQKTDVRQKTVDRQKKNVHFLSPTNLTDAEKNPAQTEEKKFETVALLRNS